MKLDRNKKIALGIGVFALLYIAYKKGIFGGSKNESTDVTTDKKTTAKESAKDVSVTTTTDVMRSAVTERPMPVVSTEQPQVSVVNIPPQFGSEPAVFNRLPMSAFTTFN